MRTQASSQKKPVNVARIMRTPVRAISKALDMYVKGVTNFSTTYNKPFRPSRDQATPNCQQFPRSFSTSRLPVDDQPPEGALVRSISTAATGGRGAATQINIAELELYMIQHHRHQLSSYASRKGVPRSCSVGMGKIDEDRVSSFRDDKVILKSKISINDKDSVFSRSRSYDRVSDSKRSKFM